jgi:hypothetical protein
MLNILKVETTASIIYNCHHMKYIIKYIKYICHNYDYMNKKLHF